MSLLTLHTVTVEELAAKNPSLYSEYQLLISQLVQLIKKKSDANPSLSYGSKIIKRYDTNSNEAYLEVIFTNQTKVFSSEIYIHKDCKKFIIGKSGNGKPISIAKDGLTLIENEINAIPWI